MTAFPSARRWYSPPGATGAALGAEGHVIHDGGGAAAGGGHGAGVEVVHRPVGPGLEIHVGVHVHRAEAGLLAGGVDHLGVRD